MSKEIELLDNIAIIGELLVDESKSHITPKEFVEKVRKLNVSGVYFALKKALTPPKADEVCKALSEYMLYEVKYNNNEFNFYYQITEDDRKHIVADIDSLCMLSINPPLPAYLFTLIGRFYEGLKNEKKE